MSGDSWCLLSGDSAGIPLPRLGGGQQAKRLGVGIVCRGKGHMLRLWVVSEPVNRLGRARSQVCLGRQLLLTSLLPFFRGEMSSFSAVRGRGCVGGREE